MATIIKMVNSIEMVGHELFATKRKLPKEWDKFESENSVKESNDDGHQWSKQKDEKTQLNVVRWGVYYTNCYNEGHYTKECKSLQKLCWVCKSDDHDIN
jgi:hypothetical protein